MNILTIYFYTLIHLIYTMFMHIKFNKKKPCPLRIFHFSEINCMG